MPITIPAQPFTFASESANQPAAQLDSSFANIRNALTGIALQATDLIGSYGVRGLIGNNNAGTPNTKYDLSADLVVLRNPTGGLNVQTATGTLTNDTGLAGSAAGGRDQAGAFAANTWLHFYFIWSGTTLSTLSSTVAPPTGPTLPTGYTHWAYAGAVRYNATPLLVKTRMQGCWMSYEVLQNALADGRALVETNINLATFIPPNALLGRYVIFNGAVGPVHIRLTTGNDYYVNRAGFITAGSSQLFPNVGQNLIYIQTADPGAGLGLELNIQGFNVANGGE